MDVFEVRVGRGKGEKKRLGFVRLCLDWSRRMLREISSGVRISCGRLIGIGDS